MNENTWQVSKFSSFCMSSFSLILMGIEPPSCETADGIVPFQETLEFSG